MYLMIALLLLNLTSLSSLSVPINTIPLWHSWNSSHINPPPFSPCYSTICYYSLITECLCQSDIWSSQYLFWYKSYAYCYALPTLMLVHQDWFVGLLLRLTAEDVNNKCHTAFFNKESQYRIKLWFLFVLWVSVLHSKWVKHTNKRLCLSSLHSACGILNNVSICNGF